jgi:hypothetical protein
VPAPNNVHIKGPRLLPCGMNERFRLLRGERPLRYYVPRKVPFEELALGAIGPRWATLPATLRHPKKLPITSLTK